MSKVNIITQELFNYKYPKACESVNGKYTNLPKEKFLIKIANGYTAIDNTSSDYWTEDFKDKYDALKWLNYKEY